MKGGVMTHDELADKVRELERQLAHARRERDKLENELSGHGGRTVEGTMKGPRSRASFMLAFRPSPTFSAIQRLRRQRVPQKSTQSYCVRGPPRAECRGDPASPPKRRKSIPRRVKKTAFPTDPSLS